MWRILYPDLLVDAIFLNPRQNVNFIILIFFFFFPWATAPSALIGALVYLLIDEHVVSFSSYFMLPLQKW